MGDSSADSPEGYRNLVDRKNAQRVLIAKSAWTEFKIEISSPNLHWLASPAVVPPTSFSSGKPPLYHEPWTIRAEPPSNSEIATIQIGDQVYWNVWTHGGTTRLVTDGPSPVTFEFQGRGYQLGEGLRALASDGVVLARFTTWHPMTISSTGYALEVETLVGVLATAMLLARLQGPGETVGQDLGL